MSDSSLEMDEASVHEQFPELEEVPEVIDFTEVGEVTLGLYDPELAHLDNVNVPEPGGVWDVSEE